MSLHDDAANVISTSNAAIHDELIDIIVVDDVSSSQIQNCSNNTNIINLDQNEMIESVDSSSNNTSEDDCTITASLPLTSTTMVSSSNQNLIVQTNNNPVASNDDNIELLNNEVVDNANNLHELHNEEEVVFHSSSNNSSDDFGDFEAFPKKTLSLTSITDNVTTNDELQGVVSDIANLDIIDTSLAEDYCENIVINNHHPVSAVDVEIENFGDFEYVNQATATINEHPSAFPKASHSNLTDVINIVDQGLPKNDDSGAFDGFVDSKVVESSELDNYIATTISSTLLPVVVDSVDDDDFGDFGEFNAFEDVSNATDIAGPRSITDAIDGDAFGEFGDFNAFEEGELMENSNLNDADINVAPTAEDNAAVTAPAVVVPTSPNDDCDDEIDDFGEFEDSDAVVQSPDEEKHDSIAPAASQERPDLYLSEDVRKVFQRVFATENDEFDPDEDWRSRETCTELPWNIPMQEILDDLPPRQKTARPYKSERDLAELLDFFASLTPSRPQAIISDENMYPYSQYEFNWEDGSPTIKLGKENKNKRVKPAVPELLPIVLPVGEFETHNKTSGSTTQLPSSQPTIINIPSTTFETGSEGTTNVDAQQNESDQLSAKGKKMLNQLPDLSYMLQSTLCLTSLKR